jgi:pyruvate,orthophosphate dikinase
MPAIYRELSTAREKLEKHYRDMQDIEFTIQQGRLWMLQTRTGKRNGPAAIAIAVDMVREGLIREAEAVLRVRPNQLDELLHDLLDPRHEKTAKLLAKGLPAGPGGGSGQVVFTAEDAAKWSKEGKKIILVRNETSPEDVQGMHVAEAILTAKGGMTSHAALVARGWGKCCIVGCAALGIDAEKKILQVNGVRIAEGDWISLNGTLGHVYLGRIPSSKPDLETNASYQLLMKWADSFRRLKIRTNADRPQDAAQARVFGAEGIGLTRTEHMFFGPERIRAMREMILAETAEERRRAVMKLLPFQKKDFAGLFQTMQGLPVTIRLLDPPLHEFINLDSEQLQDLAAEMGVPQEKIRARAESLHELNPMLGHRGCRLGIAYPEITEMQAQAIFEAASDLAAGGIEVHPEIMVPLIGSASEFRHQDAIIRRIGDEVAKKTGVRLTYQVGTMIEIPRAALTADAIAQQAQFFSFGTNDLTQTTFGFSRDDIGGFLPYYLEHKILPEDPFQSLDQEGVGQLIEIAIRKGRGSRPDLKVGICGEHGGDPKSIDFCHRMGMNYVSCSPFRVPIARLAAAHAALTEAECKPKSA